MRSGISIGVLLLSALALSAPAWAASRTPCPDGVFLTDGKPFTTALGETEAGVITVEAGALRVESVCDDPVLAKVRGKKKFDTVKGKWEDCEAFPSKVKFKAKIDAETCQDMEGSLGAKGIKPKKQKFKAVRLDPAALELLDALNSAEVRARMADENFPYVIHPAAEYYNPELTELIDLGSDAVPALLAAFRRPAILSDEIRLSLYAVALERLGDPRAVSVLADWLEDNLETASLVWAPHLVTHALKVLSDHVDVDAVDFTYDVDEMLDTIARVRLGGFAVSSSSNARRRLARSSHRQPNNCSAKIYVTGVNGAGASETFEVTYAIYDKDIQQRMDEEPAGPDLATFVQNYFEYKQNDERKYGGTDYVPIDPEGDVSILSNCGGSVVERMLNEVARVKGLPFELGRGTATAKQARDLANTFGGPVDLAQLEPLLGVISHDTGQSSAHVEIPLSRPGANQLLVYSKDVQGLERQHTIVTEADITTDFFSAVRQVYNFRPFYADDSITTNFYQIDPARVTDIRIDTSACDCRFRTGVDVTIDTPGDEAEALTTTVAGTASGAPVTSGFLRINGKPPQSVEVVSGAFSAEVELRPGDNELRLAFESPDGRRGCAERTVMAPCEFTDPEDPFNGGGLVRLSVDGGSEIEWPGYTGISILNGPRKIVWFGAPPTGQPNILFELYGPKATRTGTWPVQLRPTSDNAFERDFAVGAYRSQEAVLGSSFRHQLTAGTLTVEEIETGKQRILSASFDVTAVSDEDGSSKQLRGRVDLCRFGIERRSGISLAD